MRIWRRVMLFSIGGCGYMLLEFLWRGWSHGSMFLAGGLCFLLLGRLENTSPRLSAFGRAVMGSVVITSVELLAGLLTNRDYGVWDYRNVPLNFHGQVCLPFSLLWLPVSLGAMYLYRVVSRAVSCKWLL